METNASFLETAAQHLVRRVPLARAEDAVAAVLARLPGSVFDDTDAVYVVDEDGRLRGLVRLSTLLAAHAERQLGDLMLREPPTVHPGEDQEQIALVAIRHKVGAVPVVDDAGRLLGVVPAEALIEILRREHVEDLHRLAGIIHMDNHVYEALLAPPARRLRSRLPWLLVGLLGSTVATAVMAYFEGVLEKRVAIAFFVPAIVYLADAVGTQTEAIVVRYLSVRHAPLGRLLVGEMTSGLLIGLSLGVFILPAVWLGFGDLRLALVVSLTVVAAGTCAASLGMLLPWLLSSRGRDPALGSGPVATVIQDVLSLLIYFALVVLLLR